MTEQEAFEKWFADGGEAPYDYEYLGGIWHDAWQARGEWQRSQGQGEPVAYHSARFEFLMAELEKRFPAPNPYPSGLMFEVYALEQVDKQLNGQGEPVAWLSTDCIGERFLCFTKPTDNDPVEPLYLSAPTIPEGWQLVPKKTDLAMRQALATASGKGKHLVDIWEDVLAAAPTPES